MHIKIVTLKKKSIADFAKERNSLLKMAKPGWILFLDSDESLSPELVSEIENLNPGENIGFYIYRKNYFLEQYIGTDKILRLAKNGSGKWERSVHETWKVKGKRGILKNPIIHNTAGSLNEYIKKINYYSELHADENLKKGKKSNLLKIIFYPPAKFIQSVFSGRGFVFSMLQSFHSFLAWSKEWNLQKD